MRKTPPTPSLSGKAAYPSCRRSRNAMQSPVGVSPSEAPRGHVDKPTGILPAVKRLLVIALAAGSVLASPLVESVHEVARQNGVSRLTANLSASRANRRTAFVAGGNITSDEHLGGDRVAGTAGGAFSWRLKPVAPGATGGPGLAFFFEG